MKRIISTLFLIVSLLCFFTYSSNAQTKKYYKLLKKHNKKYETGDYGKAQKFLKKIQKKTTKKIGEANSLKAKSLILEAKILANQGVFNEFYSKLESGLKMSDSINDTNNHAKNLLEASYTLSRYGDYRGAKEYFNKAEPILGNSDSVLYQKSTILSNQGYYNQAFDIATNLEKTLALSATSKSEKKLYAKVIILKADILRKKGNYLLADSLFIKNDYWLAENLKPSHVLYAKNKFLNTKLLDENGLSSIVQADMYEGLKKGLKRKYKPSHHLIMEINERLMKAYFSLGVEPKFKKLRSKFKKTTRSFGRKSIYREYKLKQDADLLLSTRNLGGVNKKLIAYAGEESLPKIHPLRIETLKLARKYELLNENHKNATAYSLRIADMTKELIGENTPVHSLEKISYANDLVDFSDKLDEAGKIYTDNFLGSVKKEISKGHIAYPVIQNHLAKYYELTDKYKKATEAFEDALLTIHRKYDNEDLFYALQLQKLAKHQIKIGEYIKANDSNNKAIEIFQSINSKLTDVYKGASMLTEAKLKIIAGDYDDAEDLIEEGNELIEEGVPTEDKMLLATPEDLAEIYVRLGKYKTAQKILNRTYNEFKEDFGENSRRLIRPMVLNAEIYFLKGEYADSEKIASKALKIAEKNLGESSSQTAPARLLLSNIQNIIGDYKKAEDILLKVLKIQENTFDKNHLFVGKTLTKIASIKFNKGDDINEIEKLLKRAEEIIANKAGKTSPSYAEVLKDMAILNMYAKRYPIALDLIKKANKIWAKKISRRNNINTALVQSIIGDIYYNQSVYKSAEKHYKKAKKQYRKVFSKEHPDYVKVQAKLSKTHFMQEEYKNAQDEIEDVLNKNKEFIATYFPNLSEREKTKYWNNIRKDYEYYNTLIISRNRSAKYIGDLYDNALITKALLLNSSIKVRQRIMNSGDSTLTKIYSDWLANKEELIASLSMSDEELATKGIDKNKLIAKSESLEKELNAKSELFASENKKKRITWKNIQKSLKENEAAIEMVRFRHFDKFLKDDSVRYAMLYVKKDQDPELILLNNGKDLESKYLKLYRNVVKFGMKNKMTYNQFWKPIADKIGAVSTLYISPDGVYNQINLEAIPTPDNRYIIDDSNITLLSNTKDLFLQKDKKTTVSKNEITLYGNPSFYLTASTGNVSPLPGTKTEINELDELLSLEGWKSTKHLGTEVTESDIKKIASPKVFHIATHGFFQEGPKEDENSDLKSSNSFQNPLLKSGLLLAGAGDILNETSFNFNKQDGILTAYEAMNLNLDNTDLVILSACETGKGEIQAGEGVYGLQRSFLVAGAKSIIMSLFKVDDGATQKLMVKFYKKWIQTGDKRQAFIDAKKEIRNEYQKPIYWAPFVMIGLN